MGDTLLRLGRAVTLPSVLLVSSSLYIGYSLLQYRNKQNKIANNPYIKPVINSLINHYKQQQSNKESSSSSEIKGQQLDIIIVHDSNDESKLEQVDEVAQQLYKQLTYAEEIGNKAFKHIVNVYSITKEEFIHYDQYNASKGSFVAVVYFACSYPSNVTQLLTLCGKAAKLLKPGHPFITLLDHSVSSLSSGDMPLSNKEIGTVYSLSGYSDIKPTTSVDGHAMTMITSVSPSWSIGETHPINLLL
ncbi:hypothetical protein SAMD00019534_083210 [Acytostelium subglobosum LB1]|uniref:hypothetical protein n=1 Tax=Acytostelium subglobosum LB1 TaxID=1410327 RepID=UPI000644CA6C|nr:hypothetical protein SAMD00019534_083210 [Acytostelium subglobosum LB1]GAM25146.1 hypothetical protein SAMD00019534_083210 [Acytostelium subglobosum LB1]|eukprot:XP_012751666.1 hypothetical protein SAMD00019534_083210 [Acytostelium subglobosum LB1]